MHTELRHHRAVKIPPNLTVIQGGLKGKGSQPLLKAPLTAAKAAREFASWLRSLEEDRLGSYTDRQLSARYAEFCEASDLTPTAENLMRDELKKLAGIRRETVNDKTRDGKRRRAARWHVSAPNRKRRAA